MDSSYTLGEVLGPVFAGLLIGWWGVPAMLGVHAAVGLVAELQAVLVLRRAPLPDRGAADSATGVA